MVSRKNTMICKIVFLTVFLPSFAGGFSTMIALSLLVTSRSHIFTSFFKIFLLICLFGLFHGLVMLPVLLCLFGPVDISEEQLEADKEAQAQPDKMFSLKFNIPIQCAKGRTIGKGPSVWNKIATQMVAKVGGVPWVIDKSYNHLGLDTFSAVVGIDVCHAGR